jgi:hypothetical protein
MKKKAPKKTKSLKENTKAKKAKRQGVKFKADQKKLHEESDRLSVRYGD